MMSLLVRRRIACGFAVLLFGVGLTLSGCGSAPKSTPLGGQSYAEAEKLIDSVPGLAKAKVEWNADYETPWPQTSVYVLVYLDSGYRVADGQRLVDFLVRTAWSARDHGEPNDGLSISVVTPAGSSFNVSDYFFPAWSATSLPIDAAVPSGDGGELTGLWIQLGSDHTGNVASKKLGSWPGEVAAAPIDAVVKN